MDEPLTRSERGPVLGAGHLRTAGAAIAVAAGMVLLGWWLEVPAARSLVPGWRVMVPTSALCFVFLGTALAVRAGEQRGLAGTASLALSLAVVAVALASLHEYATGIRSGLETWGGVWQFAGQPYGGRMSPMTSLVLLVLAIGVTALVVPGHGARTVARLSAGTALFAVWLGVLALSVDSSRLANEPRFPGMAASTLLFALLTGATVLALTAIPDPLRPRRPSGLRWPIWTPATGFVVPPLLSQVHAGLSNTGLVDAQLLTATVALTFSLLLAVVVWRFATRLAAAQRAQARILSELEGHVEQRTRALTESNDSLRRHQATLSEADRRKDEFLALLAHELRNPLAPIRTAAHVVGAGHASLDQQRRAGAIIERQVAVMRRLIDDLLDVSRITADKLQIRSAPVALSEVLDLAVATTRPLIDESRHELTVVAPDPDLYVEGDAARLAQALGNLLHNASKFTPAGGHLALTARRAADGMAEVIVRDDGIGIEPAFVPRLFEKFAQARPGAGRTQGGLGLGLALVQGIVARHGGSVSAASAGPGHGSTFVVRLPLAPAGALVTPAPNDIDTTRTAPARRVLIVDDNEDNVTALAALLALDGHDVATAFDGATGLELAAAAPPDAMLVDLGMPGMDGCEVARRVRATDWGRSVLLVAQTGFGQARDRQQSREAGFDHHLTKPVDLGDLRRLLAAPPLREARAS